MDIKKLKLTLEDCFTILEYWLKSDNDMCILKQIEYKEMMYQEKEREEEDKSLEKNVKDILSGYQKLMDNCKNEEEKNSIRRMMEEVEKTVGQIQKRTGESAKLSPIITKPIKSELVQKEKREKSLLQIYSFYSKQFITLGKFSTFDRLKEEANNIDQGKFLQFCIQYELCSKEAFTKKVNK